MDSDHQKLDAGDIVEYDPNHRIEALEAEVKFLREREAYFAKVLGVCDGGRYRADWATRIKLLVEERDRLELAVGEISDGKFQNLAEVLVQLKDYRELRSLTEKMILAALPVSVTIEQLREWVPTIPANFDVSGHGLEVVERVREIAYNQRTKANTAAKDARGEADRAKTAADAFGAEPEGVTTVVAMVCPSRLRGRSSAPHSMRGDGPRR